jgi:thiamine biosynthesis lipoprotein
MTHKSHRRDFLRGKAAADALADAMQAAVPEGGPGDVAAGGDFLLRVSRRAMACEFEVCFNAGDDPRGTELALEALDLIDALEEQLSYFRETSELMQINRHAADGPVEVEPRLFALLELAVQIFRETGGAFDITSTPLWEAWGFARRAGEVPTEEKLAEALACVGSQHLELDAARRTIRFLRPDVRLNLGSLGKGFALDRCAEYLTAAGLRDFLLHGGYSSVLARGSEATLQAAAPADTSAGWIVGVRHPLRPERRVAELRLRGRAISTSGSMAQAFWHQGRRYGHILDPRSGRPADTLLSATAVADNATLAEALSTAFFVMGPEAALEYCRQRPDVAAVLLCPARRSGGVEIRSAGLAAEELTVSEMM